MVPCKSTAEEVSFEWSHHRISSTDSEVRTTLHVSIIDSGSERGKQKCLATELTSAHSELVVFLKILISETKCIECTSLFQKRASPKIVDYFEFQEFAPNNTSNCIACYKGRNFAQ